MNKILKTYEVVFLITIYTIIAGYSVRAMLNLIEEVDSPSSFFKTILLDTFWAMIIVILGALIISVSFKHKTRR